MISIIDGYDVNINTKHFEPGNFLCPQSDYRLDHEVRCTFPMSPKLERTTTLAILQLILEDKMLRISVHFVVGHDKCTARTSAKSIEMLTGTGHPSFRESKNSVKQIM